MVFGEGKRWASSHIWNEEGTPLGRRHVSEGLLQDLAFAKRENRLLCLLWDRLQVLLIFLITRLGRLCFDQWHNFIVFLHGLRTRWEIFIQIAFHA